MDLLSVLVIILKLVVWVEDYIIDELKIPENFILSIFVYSFELINFVMIFQISANIYNCACTFYTPHLQTKGNTRIAQEISNDVQSACGNIINQLLH